MNKADREAYKAKLVALRDRHNGDASHLASEALQRNGEGSPNTGSTMPIHMADLGTDAYEQEFTLSLLQNEEQFLAEIEAALSRLAIGSFGRCEECEADIPKARLQAVPYARTCVACARKREEKR